MRNLIIIAAALVFSCCFASSNVTAQEWCQDGNVLWCVDNCELECQQDESTEGFFMCQATAVNHMAAKCSCDAGLGVFTACMVKLRTHFVEAARRLEKLKLIEKGTAKEIRRWVKQELDECAAGNP